MSAKHTAIPWGIEAVSDAVRIVVGKGRQKVIIARLCPPQLPEAETWENARLIVRSVNSHDALVKALQGFVSDECHCGEPGVQKPCVQCDARAALALATKEGK